MIFYDLLLRVSVLLGRRQVLLYCFVFFQQPPPTSHPPPPPRKRGGWPEKIAQTEPSNYFSLHALPLSGWFIFAKHGGGCTTTHLYIHYTFLLALWPYEITPIDLDTKCHNTYQWQNVNSRQFQRESLTINNHNFILKCHQVTGVNLCALVTRCFHLTDCLIHFFQP